MTQRYERLWLPAKAVMERYLTPAVGREAHSLLQNLWLDGRVRARMSPFADLLPPEPLNALSLITHRQEFNTGDIKRELERMRRSADIDADNAPAPSPARVTMAQANSAAIVDIARELGVTPQMSAKVRDERISAHYKDLYGKRVGRSKIAEALRGTGMIRPRPPRRSQPD